MVLTFLNGISKPRLETFNWPNAEYRRSHVSNLTLGRLFFSCSIWCYGESMRRISCLCGAWSKLTCTWFMLGKLCSNRLVQLSLFQKERGETLSSFIRIKGESNGGISPVGSLNLSKMNHLFFLLLPDCIITPFLIGWSTWRLDIPIFLIHVPPSDPPVCHRLQVWLTSCCPG